MMINKGNMVLQERLHKYIESAWTGIVYDGTLQITQAAGKFCTYKDYTVYDIGQQRQIAFTVDILPEKDAADAWNIISELSRQFPVCTKYNFTIGDVEDGIRQKVLLIIESAQ